MWSNVLRRMCIKEVELDIVLCFLSALSLTVATFYSKVVNKKRKLPQKFRVRKCYCILCRFNISHNILPAWISSFVKLNMYVHCTVCAESLVYIYLQPWFILRIIWPVEIIVTTQNQTIIVWSELVFSNFNLSIVLWLW